MNNSTPIVSARIPYLGPQRRLGCWRRFLSAGLTLGFAAVLQTASADTTIYLNNFNNATNDLSNNDLGVGGGFTAFSYNNGVNAYFPSAFETNSWNGSPANGYAVLANSTIGDLYSSLDTINSFNLSAVGTTFELSGVSFSTNTPIPNGGGGASGNVDRLIWGVTTIAPAGAWLSAGPPGAIPTGFWIQFNSDSLVTGTGVGSWSGTSTLFYKDTGTNIYQLCSWKFDNLHWTNGTYQFSPTLDVQLTLAATGWALNITGDTSTNLPISYSGTYAGPYTLAGTANSGAINPLLLNGISSSYWGGFNQTANPGIAMQIDQAKVTQLGTLVVTTPQIMTPEYGFNTNAVLAGEAVALTSIVTDSAGTPTFKWQIANLSGAGTFSDLPSGNAATVNVDTSTLLGNYGIQLIATDGGLSVTSAVVTLAVNVASAPVVVEDPTPAVLNLYQGAGGRFDAIFSGNLPISYQWQYSPDYSTFTDIPGATNSYYIIQSANTNTVIDGPGVYQVVASNSLSLGIPTISDTVGSVQITPGTPQYLWSAPYRFGGQNANQILTNFPSTSKIAGAMYATNGGLPLVVPTSAGNIAFGANGVGSIGVSGYTGYGTGASTNQTGNASFNTCLNDFVYDNTQHSISLSNLIVGQTYQVQLFGLDDRSGNTRRLANWMDPLNAADVSVNYQMGDNVYFLATFVASNTVQVIQQNLVDTNSDGLGNFNCAILRTVGWTPAPYFALQPQNNNYFTQTNAILVGVAGGDPSLGAITYQWQSGPVGGPYNPLTEGTKYNGTTTTTLTISNLAVADGAPVYVLTAHNNGGYQNSRETVLLIQPIPPTPVPGSYAAVALANNPVALWMLNETNDPSSGTVKGYDYTGNGHNVTFGTAIQDGFNGIQGPRPPTYAGFYADQSAMLSVNGNLNALAYIPNLGNTNLQTTVGMWFKPNSGETGNYAHGLIGGRNNAAAGQIWQLGYSAGSGTLGYNWNDVSGTYTYNTGLSPVQNAWNYVAMVISSNNATFYLYTLNSAGQAIQQKAVNNVANVIPISMSGGTTVIGNDPYALNSRGFNGAISGVALYNSALTESQIQGMVAAGLGLPGGGLPPSFVTQPPATLGGYAGTIVQLSTASSGTTPITNQWTFTSNNVAYNLVDGNYSGTIITGSTSNVLTIANVTTNWAGVYNLILSNQVTYLASSNTVFTVLTAPPVPGAGTFGATALSLNPILYYQLDETNDPSGGGTPVYDYSGNNRIGTYGAGSMNKFNGVLSPQPPAFPGFAAGQGALLATTNQLNSAVTVPPLNLNTNTVTMCMWINPTSSVPVSTGLLFERGGAETAGFGFGGTVNSSGMAGLGYNWNNNSSTAYNYSSGLYPVTNTWQFVAMVIRPASATFYLYYKDPVSGQQKFLSAVQSTTLNNQGFTNNAGTLLLGGDSNNANRTFPGLIADAAVYKASLTDQQILSLYGAGLQVAGFAPSVTMSQGNVYYPAPLAPGQTLRLSASVGGTAIVTNQWQLNGVSLQNGTSGGVTISGATSNVLTIANVNYNYIGSYQLLATNAINSATSSIVSVVVTPATIVGQWLSGGQTLADVSGYQPAGTHDATVRTGSTSWVNDVPPGAPPGNYSLQFSGAGLQITNTAVTDNAYTNTFDDQVYNGMTVMLWAKGLPSGIWQSFVAKNGENNIGWQVRIGNATNRPTWTIRNAQNQDMQVTAMPAYLNDGNWHHYAGTFNPATGNRYLYVDGTLVGFQTGDTLYPSAKAMHLTIGYDDQSGTGNGSTDGPYIGKMYDVRIYNYPLPQSQIAAVIGKPNPQGYYVTPGSVASFTTPGIPIAPPYTGYRWQFNGANLSDGVFNGATVSGSSTISMSVSNITTLNAGIYQLLVTNATGSAVSRIVNLTVLPATTVGRWVSGAQNLNDVSGYQPAGTHNAGLQSGSPNWSTDVPASAPGGSYSLQMSGVALIVSNSSILYDAGYTNTFDNQIYNGMTVMCWAKGLPGGWNPWLSKYGDSGSQPTSGWMLRVNNSSNPTWSIRGTGGNEDMSASKAYTDGNWHQYAGTYSPQTGVRSLYVDGVLVAQQTGQGPYTPATGERFVIGGKDSPPGNSVGSQYTGKLYDVRIYDYAMSQAQLGAAVPGLTPSFVSTPLVTTGPSGHQFVMTWSFGSLLQATNVAGPWTSTGATSPYTNVMNTLVPDVFFKLSNP